MNFNNFFKKDRDELRTQKMQEANASMAEAGSLFDETVIKLTEAQRKIDLAKEECEEEIRYHQEQIEVEKEAASSLERKRKSVSKVVQNIKELFLFEDLD